VARDTWSSRMKRTTPPAAETRIRAAMLNTGTTARRNSAGGHSVVAYQVRPVLEADNFPLLRDLVSCRSNRSSLITVGIEYRIRVIEVQEPHLGTLRFR
jgi:hypothetical protein